MRGKLSILVLWFPLLTYAQGSSQNYVKETSYLDSLGNNITNVSYFDGLGNLVETASTGSGTSNTIYSFATYDSKGRERVSYYPTPIGSGLDFKEGEEFMAASQAYYGDAYAFGQKSYDYSDCVVREDIAGKAWHDHGAHNASSYDVNTADDKVIIIPSPKTGVNGLLAGSIVRTSNGQFVFSVYCYDPKGNLTHTLTKGLEGYGSEITSTYSLTDKPVSTLAKVDVRYGDKLSISVSNAYSTRNGMLSSTRISLEHGHRDFVSDVSYEYDALNRLSKVIRPDRTGAVSYTYDVHGWPTKIESKNFKEYLSYADGMGTPCYNGNISVLQWKNSTYYCPRGYKFTYDVNNRMTNALYCEGNELERPVGRFNEFVGYDLNGNITSLQREGYRDGGYGIIDDLSIGLSGNQVTHVTDATEENISEGSLDFNGESSYRYNTFGALESDSGRGITRIDYDDNENPARIQFSNGNVTKYVYSAEGEKLRTIYYTAMPNISVADGEVHELTAAETLAVDSVDYLLGGNLILKNGRIERYLFEGGYFEARALNLSSDDFLIYYYTKDHIGNNREVVDRYGSVCQAADYYPYGTPYGDLTTTEHASFQPFKYNGKEFDMMHGLNTYDYGARQYNPIVPTWDRMDNLCEQQSHNSPYLYCNGNPINNTDPDGNDYWGTNDQKQIMAFWNAIGAGQTQYDFSGWQHATDATFSNSLVYNDETKRYYTSYSQVVDGELTVVGKSFSANMTPVSFDGTGYVGAYAFEPISKFRTFLTGGVENYGGTNWYVNRQGRLVGYAPIMGVIDPSLLPEFAAAKIVGEAKLVAKGARVCREFGFSHNQKVYKLRRKYYSWDVDKHNNGYFKVFEKKGGELKRIGTVDENFDIFKK